jgi:Uma2 family endonuclease
MPAQEPHDDQVVVLRPIPWDLYVAWDDARGEQSNPHVAYLDGMLEIMTHGPKHESDKKLIARLVEAYAEEHDLQLSGFGNTTWRKKKKETGLEPDECYFLGKIKRFPDLAIEVVRTSGGVDKLEIYRRLGVREVWFWVDEAFHLFELVGRAYHPIPASRLLPDLDLSMVAEVVRTTEPVQQTQGVRRFRGWLRRASS